MRNTRKGFTIVELVIVIAVIAILAAVLIPTFVSLTKKANLNSDMQAVRQMNLALKADEAINGKAKDIETAMQIIANAGYDVDNWTCLSEGYQVYWYKTDNRCILYNSATAEVEYPTDYAADIFIKDPTNFEVYNQNYKNALGQDFNLGSSNNTNKESVELGSNSTGTNKVIFDSLVGESANSNLQSSIGITGDKVYVNASLTTDSASKATGTYASMQIMQVGSKQEDLSSSETIVPNMIYLNVVQKEGATAEQIITAQKEAGELVYSVFVQMNNGDIPTDCNIVLAPGTTINVSSHEWRAVKTFSGYFGSADASKPVIIDGMKLSTATGYAQTYTQAGTNSKYFMTGFFGVVYGETTIENVTFRNVTIKSPGADYQVVTGKNSRNTVAIIGGIVPYVEGVKTNVTIRNVNVESSCSIIGEASVGGLVGYIGGEAEALADFVAGSTVTIENCNVAATLESLDQVYVTSGYSPVGGIVGFSTRCKNMTVSIKDSDFTGTAKGYGRVGGILGNPIQGAYTIEGCSAETATLTTLGNGTHASTDKVVALKGSEATVTVK